MGMVCEETGTGRDGAAYKGRERMSMVVRAARQDFWRACMGVIGGKETADPSTSLDAHASTFAQGDISIFTLTRVARTLLRRTDD